ncbi:MAG TPA: sulfatase-like hydrolase/transferase [Opitutaceae bacterium]|jgi:arylsulfatase A-like enzyme
MLRLGLGAGALAAAGRLRAAAVPALAALRRRPPNILMIVADDMRHDLIGALGDPMVCTPNLDRLAAGGTAFRSAHHMGGKFSAVCVPTRGALLTGCNVFRAMVDPADNVIAQSRITIGEHLRLRGYDTYCVGKWHNDFGSLNRSFANGEGIFLRGLNRNQYRMRVHHYDPTGAYGSHTAYDAQKFSSDFLADHAVDYLGQQDGNRPFFLYTAFTSPHDPRTPPSEYAELYPAERMKLPPNFLPCHPFDNGELHVRDEDLAPHPRTAKRIRQEIAAYFGMVSSMDASIGRILSALDDSGLAENTIVVFTADHGLAVGQHGLLGKQNLYEHSLRVPLVLRGPGVPAGARSDALVYSWDTFPTLCDLAGQPAPRGLDARSLAPLFANPEAPHRRRLSALYRDFQRAAQDERWKLIEYTVGGRRRTQVFDLQNDPWERHDLAADSAAMAEAERLRPDLIC